MDFYVDEISDGETVLQVIKKRLNISSGHLKHLKFIENGITVNGKHVTVRYVLSRGDVLSLATDDTEEASDIPPVPLDLSVAYEDRDCIVPSKPADMPTHPSHGHYSDTVANALAYLFFERGECFVFRPVNRLDRNTSGLLLIAKNRIAAGRLSEQMGKGEIKKAYVAILCGCPPKDSGVIETYMRRTAESIIVRENCAADEGGDYALTKYRVLYEKNGYTVVLASPITGRTHQLRVHFSGLGAPILGDDMYGESSELITRQALHSCCLSFCRVSDGERVCVTDRLPEDMLSAAQMLFGDDFDTEEIYKSCESFLSHGDLY